MSLEGLGVTSKERVDQSKKLHHPLILPQVLMTLQKEHEILTITTCRMENV